MTVYISLLRGINVSGQKKIKMAALKALFESLDLQRVQTYIQSGNVVFESADTDPLALANSIRERIKNEFGFAVDVTVWPLSTWHVLVERNPFSRDSERDTKHLHVTLLADVPDEQRISALGDVSAGADEFQIVGQFVYLYCPTGYGRTKLTNTFWEQKLKVSATTRNWKTVNTLLALAEELD